MLNNIALQGRLVHSPELRYTKSETPVAHFSIACDRDRKNADGEKETDFVECCAFGETAKFIDNYFQKGMAILLNGRLQMRKWVDKDNNKRISAEVIAERVWFCESKRKDEDRNRIPAAEEYTGWDGESATPKAEYADADEKLPWE